MKQYYHGRTGVVFGVTQRGVGVLVNKRVGNRIVAKRLCVRIEHVRPSRCREDFVRRVQQHAAQRRAGEHVCMKRQPEGPRGAHVVACDGQPETVRPQPYETAL